MFRLPRLQNWRDALVLCLLIVGLQQLARAGYIQGKAHLAQLLIGRAWERSLDTGGTPQKPWPWADTWPVAHLEVRGLSVDLYVLAGATGNALAFGPGYERASAELGQPGLSVIGGHRDTHFAFLREMKSSASFSLRLATGERIDYVVDSVGIIDTYQESQPQRRLAGDELLLVTCYPFDSLLPGGPLRYVVSARPRIEIAEPTIAAFVRSHTEVFEL